MIPTEGVPTSLQHAYQFLGDDRAWVACLVHGEGQVMTLASRAKTHELLWNPVTSQYLNPACPRRDRAEFLLGGIQVLVDEVSA